VDFSATSSISPINAGNNRGHGNPTQYGSITGEFDHSVQTPGGTPHVRFDMTANGKQFEADINENADSEYAIRDEVVPSMPPDGEKIGGSFSYADAGLKQGDFKPMDDTYQKTMNDLASHSSRIQLMGQIYGDNGRSGIHDIHMNSLNEEPNEGPQHDGVARFYVNEGGQIHQESVYMKFQNQELDGQTGN